MIEAGVGNTKVLDSILQAASKHPNSRVSKLIHSVEEECSQKNIVLLLIELAEHAEYATDFSISLKYYLDLFEQFGVGREIVLNEAGLLLLNSSKVYARRVDFVQELVERQILTLSNADKENLKNSAENQTKNSTEKTKRTRKRLVAPVNDPYEVELLPRKYRKLTEEKRFVGNHSQDKPKIMPSRFYRIESEQYIHPAAWIHTSIIDLENEEDIDSKRNYKLFTYHVEHRYNTLVTDINFRLHFKVKDYIDEEEERLAEGEDPKSDSNNHQVDWPPLSEEYVEKYLDLENKALALGESVKQHKKPRLENTFQSIDLISSKVTSLENVQTPKMLNQSNLECYDKNLNQTSDEPHNDSMPQESGYANNTSLHNTPNIDNSTKSNDSAILETSEKGVAITSGEDLIIENLLIQSVSVGCTQNLNSTEKSILESSNEYENSLNHSQGKSMESNLTDSNSLYETNRSQIPNSTIAEQPKNDSGLGESINDENQGIAISNTNNKNYDFSAMNTDLIDDSSEVLNEVQCVQKIIKKAAEETNDENEINLNKIRVYLPHLDDEGVFFSDLDEQEHRMLSPRVITTDVFPSIPNKENISIFVDDDIRTLLNVIDDEPPPTYTMPVQIQICKPPIELNIFKIHEKILRRRLLFRLGREMDSFLQSRSMKKKMCVDEQRQYRPMNLFNGSTDVSKELIESKICSLETDYNILSDNEDTEDFLGFTEEEQAGTISHRLSRDSGVGADVPFASKVCCLEVSSENLNETPLQSSNPQDEKIADHVEKNNENSFQKNFPTLLVSEENQITTSDNWKSQEQAASSDFANNVDAEVNKTTAHSSSLNEDSLQEIKICKSKIQKWHEYLQPILAKARDRHHFDVFQLGTEIMNELQKPIISGGHIETSSITFKDVMFNKEESYVSRYFLSTLLLANQNNIKIGINNKCNEKPSAWNDINLELLDAKRHTVAIEDNIGIIQSKVHFSTQKKPSISSVAGSEKLAKDKGVVNVNLNVVRPLKQIEKLASTSDDYDSGIFSAEECPS